MHTIGQHLVPMLLLTAALPMIPVHAQIDQVSGNLYRLNDNGAWSWYQDERVLFNGNQLLVSSIGNAGGQGGTSRAGVVDVVTLDLNTRKPATFNLSTIQADDHNSAALMVRPDGRYLALYGNHGSDNFTRYRISTNPGDSSSWRAEQSYNNGIGATYSNTFFLSAENKTYNFTRTDGYDPNFLTSTDQGSTWTYGGHLLKDPAASDSGRPYLKYASNGVDKIFFISTEGHPRDFNNSIYAGYISNGNEYRSDGTLVGPAGTSTATAPSATAFTTVAAANASVDGEVRTHYWTTDLQLDSNGNPYAAFTSRVNSSSTDHRFYYGRWDGSQWNVHQIAKAGGYLYSSENDYTGLVALDPDDPNTLYISTKIHPVSGTTMSHYEIFKGVTTNDGTEWNWSAITQNSSVDNIRPIVPKSNGTSKAVLWARGTYTTYTNYNMAVVGLIQTPAETSGPIQFVDATIGNTTRVSGSGAWNTGPATGQGAADNLWQRRSGFGNGGELFTADENTAEDVPAIVTSVSSIAAGNYDVFAFFWGNPNENWQIRAGLSSNDLLTFEKLSAQHVTLADISGAGTVSTAGSEVMYKAYLGRTLLSSAGQIQVFVDDNTGIGTSRTWFDGIGYSLITSITSSQWTGAVNSLWSNINNWSAGEANAIGQTANFNSISSGNFTVTLDGPKTVSAIKFDSAASYTIGTNAGSPLTLQTTAGNALLNVASGNHTIAASMNLASNVIISNTAGTSLNLTSPLLAPNRSVTKSGTGTLKLERFNLASLNLSGGTTSLSAKPAANSAASQIASLSIAAGATLDVTNNSLVVSYVSIGTLPQTLRQMIQDGRITTSLSAGGFAIGFADNALLGKTEFGGQPVPPNSMLLEYTLSGDVDLDGKVTTSDFNRLAGSFGTSAGRIWYDGDLNYDGAIDSQDFTLLAANYGRVMPIAISGSIVPEPTSALALLLLFCRARPASSRRTP